MMSKAQIVREMASHGFALSRETDDLPWQHAMAFRPVAEIPKDFAPRQVLRGFAAAVRGVDRRVAQAYLARGVMLPETLTPPRDGAPFTMVSDGADAVRAAWPDRQVVLGKGRAGRWQVTAIEARPPGPDPVVRDLHGFEVHVDPALLVGPHAAQGGRALSMLANHLERISVLVPKQPLAKLRTLGIWIEREHPELANMQYHPSRGWLERRGYDLRLAKKVHIPRARALLSRAQMLKHPAVVLHELAHAYHDQVLGFDDARVVEAYRAARAARTYEGVLAHTGRRVRHYAMTNHKEYFAEATEAFFYRNDFFPFVRAELAEVDPKGHALLERIWGPAR
jgi:dipeptidyl-peptidase-4